MSLISRMLQDLEQRHSLAAADPILAGLSSVDYCAREQQRTRVSGRMLAVSAVLATLAVLAYFAAVPLVPDTVRPAPGAGTRSSSPVPAPAPVPDPQVTRSAPVSPSLRLDDTLSFLARAAVAAPAPASEHTAPRASGAGEVLISAVNVAPRDGYVDLDIALSGAARYAAYPLVAPDRLVLEISDARIGAGVERTFDSGPVRRVRARVERGVAMLVFDLQHTARIESAVMGDGSEPSLRLTLAMAPVTDAQPDLAETRPAAEVVTPGTPGDMKIRPARTERSPDALFRQGSQLLDDGDVAAGLATLSEVLAQAPSHVEGRQLMATVLLQQGDREQAASLLDAGLKQFPHTWQWAQLRAQIAISAGDHEGALALLAAAPPALALQREYHALLAAMQQRTGRHVEAVGTYHAILGHEPGRGIWWMGLGISLQALQRTREAGFAFTRALEDTSLTGDLRSFIQARRAALPEGDSA